MLLRFLLLATPAMIALPATAGDAAEPRAADRLHRTLGTDIVITAPFQQDRMEVATAVGILEGEALVRETRPTIGETLARQPGVSASWFGPGASRPILRGLDSERVRILTDGIGSFDVSNTSVDHAVAINPLAAERVEVLRGPAALLFGSGAIGGVVNVIDRRIARVVPDEPVHIDLTGHLGSAARERAIGGAFDLPVGRSGVVIHADGSFLRSSDYRSGGYVFSRALRAEAAEEGGEVAEEAMARGRVPNSDARTFDVAAGLSFIGSGGSLGFSVSRLESRYGVPNLLDLGHHDHDDDDDHDHEHDHDHHHAHQDIRLDLRQTRVDARASVALGGAFQALNFRFGFADYGHDEIEPSGEIGTSFFNQAMEARLELVQAERGGWRGASGIQYLNRRFEAIGEEAYVPLNHSDQTGLFTVQSIDLGGPRLDLGGRFERTRTRAPLPGIRRTFDALSGSAGLTVPLAAAWRLAATLSHTERAPSAEELFADGPHAATRAFERGNPDFAKERATGLDLVLRGRGDGWRLELSGFWTRFVNFIYLAPTGDEEDGLAVFDYEQRGATFRGLEAEGAVTVARMGDTRLELTGQVDFVKADLSGGGPVPRLPPLRLIGGVEANGGRFGGRIEVEHVTRQTRLAAFETDTPAWTMLNASFAVRPFGADNPTSIVASVNNIFDVEARRHSSFLKDFAPLPGRDVRLAARFSF